MGRGLRLSWTHGLTWLDMESWMCDGILKVRPDPSFTRESGCKGRSFSVDHPPSQTPEDVFTVAVLDTGRSPRSWDA